MSFGVSSLAVYFLGPVVKAAGFASLLLVMAGLSLLTTLFVILLPAQPQTGVAEPSPAPLAG